MIFRSKYRAISEQLAADLSTALRDLEIERTKRVAAETLATERLKQVEKAYEFGFKAETARDEAVKARMASVDLVNTTLLQAMAPEKPPTHDIKSFTPIPKERLHAVAEMRKSDRMFVNDILKREASKRQASKPKEQAQ